MHVVQNTVVQNTRVILSIACNQYGIAKACYCNINTEGKSNQKRSVQIAGLIGWSQFVSPGKQGSVKYVSVKRPPNAVAFFLPVALTDNSQNVWTKLSTLEN